MESNDSSRFWAARRVGRRRLLAGASVASAGVAAIVFIERSASTPTS